MPIIVSPNMDLPVPIVGQELGPAYASDINNCLGLVDSHDHSFGKGVLITPNGLNINTNLTINNNSLTDIKSLILTPQLSPSATPDSASVSGIDLYYTDGNGTVIRITESGGIAGSPGGIGGLVPPASLTYTSGNQTFTFQSDVNTSANLDAGAITLRNVIVNSPGITLTPPLSLASSYTLTMPMTLPSVTSVLAVDPSGNITSDIPVTSVAPPGSIIMFGGAAAPTGYLLCDGTSYLQSSHPDLFSAIGTAYGSVDGTHFNVPDFRGIFPRGVDGGAGNDPDAGSRTASNAGGNTADNVGSFQSGVFGAHSHDAAINGGAGGTLVINSTSISTPSFAVITNTVGGSETRPINLYVNFIIKT